MAVTKPAGTWTYEDVLALPDDGKRYEIIEGELYEMPSPSLAHARTVMRLIALLLPIIARLRGEMITAPFHVFIPGGDPVQSDLLVILPDGAARATTRGVEGPPDLAIEVVSPSNPQHDRLIKRTLYARAGVREYWLVDPEAQTIGILTLDDDAFHLAVAASGRTALVSPLLGELPITAEDLFAGSEP